MKRRIKRQAASFAAEQREISAIGNRGKTDAPCGSGGISPVKARAVFD